MQTATKSQPAAARDDPQSLYARFLALRRERKMRHRDAAQLAAWRALVHWLPRLDG